MMRSYRIRSHVHALPLRRFLHHTDAAIIQPTPLAKVLHSDILFSGPITVADYMRQCLTHPTHGYYTTNPHIFGASGDFVTAPQISPVFSELLAVWITHYISNHANPIHSGHNKNNSSIPFRLVEFGPGCASLQKALLPALSKFNCKPYSLILVDASTTLQKKQRDALQSLSDIHVPPVTWHDSADDALSALETMNKDKCIPTIFLAHEFFDALPVHVFQRSSSQDLTNQSAYLRQNIGKHNQHQRPSPSSSSSSSSSSSFLNDSSSVDDNRRHNWRELLVDVDPNDAQRGALRLVLSRTHTPASALIPMIQPRSDEREVEVCAKGLSLTRQLAQCVRNTGGAALIIDYGRMERQGPTIRAIAKHMQQAHFLTRPGEVDLTADVDFGALETIAKTEGTSFAGAVTQRQFLLRLGMAQRMRVLAKHIIDTEQDGDVADAKLQRLQQDYNRLVGESDVDMGNVYKVAAICPPSVNVNLLPGFATPQNMEQSK